MSGTSLDGIDITIVEKHKNTFSLKHFMCIVYPIALKTELNQFNTAKKINLKALAQLEVTLAKLYCSAVNKILHVTNMQVNQISAIGSHGQTIFHDASIPMSIQIGHAAFIAKCTGIKTVADFRVDDMANQGQGAPIAPAFHKFIFNTQKPIAIVNIGGIANVTIIKNNTVIGFDTGPGNALMDELCQVYLKKDYDKNGEIAASSPPNIKLLNLLLNNSFFAKEAPKSTGRDIFNLAWFKQYLTGTESLAEQISTLSQLTASTIGQAIKRYKVNEIVVCGGGVENKTLLTRIAKASNVDVVSTQKYNINPHALESFMCAWLAEQRISKQPIKLATITGASKNSILGGVWLP